MSPMRSSTVRFTCPHADCEYTDELPNIVNDVASHCSTVHDCGIFHPDAWEYLSPPFRRRVEQATQAPGELR